MLEFRKGPWAAALLAACSGSVERIDLGTIGQAVGEGLACSIDACDPGLTCCEEGSAKTCRDLKEDPNHCGSCGHICPGPLAQCYHGCCRILTFQPIKGCPLEPTWDDTLALPFVNDPPVALAVSAYGATACPDHEVVELTTTVVGQSWSTIEATSTVFAADECDCLDYELHLRVWDFAVVGSACVAAEGGSCSGCIVPDCCSKDPGSGCYVESLSKEAAADQYGLGSWDGRTCKITASIAKESKKFSGTGTQVHATVVRGSTGQTMPLTIAIESTSQ
jgi:hypothetical protein